MASTSIYIWPETPEFDERARELSFELKLPLVEELPVGSYGLVVGEKGLELCQIEAHSKRPSGIYIDFASGPMKQLVKSAGKTQPLGKAIGAAKGPPYVIDATAGLGKDALFMAAIGCRVLAIEKSPLIFALLDDGYRRGLEDDFVGPILRDRLQLKCGDSIEYLEGLEGGQRPDVVYLDPMFPESKKSALPKKEMQIFRSLVAEEVDEERLFHLALNRAKIRVVVKRPSASEPWASPVTHRFEGKMVTYDSYLCSGTQPIYIQKT